MNASQMLTTNYKGKVLSGLLHVNADDPTEFSIMYTYKGVKNKEFVLSLYWDYEQTEFLINDSECALYTFSEDNESYTKVFNVKLNKKFESSTHCLTVVVTEADYSAIKDYRQRVTMMYNFINDDSTQSKVMSPKIPYKTYTESFDYLNVLNSDLSDNLDSYITGDYRNIDTNNRIIRAKSNSKLELSFRCSNFTGEGYQLMIVELNNKQVKIEDKPYLVYKLSPDFSTIYDKLIITTPSIPGEYILTSFSVPNPFEKGYLSNRKSFVTYKIIVQ